MNFFSNFLNFHRVMIFLKKILIKISLRILMLCNLKKIEGKIFLQIFFWSQRQLGATKNAFQNFLQKISTQYLFLSIHPKRSTIHKQYTTATVANPLHLFLGMGDITDTFLLLIIESLLSFHSPWKWQSSSRVISCREKLFRESRRKVRRSQMKIISGKSRTCGRDKLPQNIS